MVANVPAYDQNLILVYWFDSSNLKFNNTVSAWALKLTLYQFIGNTTDASQTVDGLIQLGAQLESSWTICKNSMQGFAVNIYQNISPAFILIAGILATAISFLLFSSALKSRALTKKTDELTKSDRRLISKLTTEKSTLTAFSLFGNHSKTQERIDRLQQLGFLQKSTF
jgi:hypothetical protein